MLLSNNFVLHSITLIIYGMRICSPSKPNQQNRSIPHHTIEAHFHELRIYRKQSLHTETSFNMLSYQPYISFTLNTEINEIDSTQFYFSDRNPERRILPHHLWLIHLHNLTQYIHPQINRFILNLLK